MNLLSHPAPPPRLHQVLTRGPPPPAPGACLVALQGHHGGARAVGRLVLGRHKVARDGAALRGAPLRRVGRVAKVAQDSRGGAIAQQVGILRVK